MVNVRGGLAGEMVSTLSAGDSSYENMRKREFQAKLPKIDSLQHVRQKREPLVVVQSE